MKVHIHVGPGHHEKILLEGILEKGISHSFSNYHPSYIFQEDSCKPKASSFYELVKFLSWGLSNRFKKLRNRNRHLNFTYKTYDLVTSWNISNVEVLFCWPQVSLNTIRKAKKEGAIIIIDYPIPEIDTWEKWLSDECKIHSIEVAHSQFSKNIASRMKKEIELADFISVPSKFVYDSFKKSGVKKGKLITNNYGIDTNFFVPTEFPKPENAKLTVIFVGTIEIRKGVHYLIEAMNSLIGYPIELRLVGIMKNDITLLWPPETIPENIKLIGQKTKEEIKHELSTADVMVMPSLLEGLSLTILESLACGTPVIATENSGGPELIENFKNGFVIKARSPQAIASKLLWCLDNRKELVQMRKNSRHSVLDGFKKEDYLLRFFQQILLRNESN